jgi:Sulfotransferase family
MKGTTFGRAIGRLARRWRYGRPIVVVSGLPRSGTSMMMRMLEAGGVVPLQDGVRAADDSNPKGYFEFEPVKELDKDGDLSWLPTARGKAVKIISFLLTWLPEHHNYAVIFMQRHPDEIIASQHAMLAGRGEAVADGDAVRSREVFRDHLAQVERFMAGRACFRVLSVPYHEVIAAPEAAAARVAAFLGRPLDTAAMARSVERQLYRNRVEPVAR